MKKLTAEEQKLFDEAKEEQHQKAAVFRQKQMLPYEAKIAHARQRAIEFYETVENCHVSVGGLDSITLLLFLRSIGIDVPAISVSIIEDEEKAAHPEAKTTGGYLKKYDNSECAANWWRELSEQQKAVIKAIPNFDKAIFKEITGIDVDG